MSDTSIRYTFTATGHQAVVGAYTTIRNAAARTSALVTAHAAKTAGVQIAMMNRVRAASKAAETGKTTAAQTGAATRQTAAVRALQRERNVLRQLLAEYTKFEKMKTATAAAEGQKRVSREKRNQTKAARGGKFGGRVFRTGGAFLAMGAGIAMAGGIGAAVRENVSIEDMAKDIAVRGRNPGGQRLNPSDIANNARRTAMAVPGARGKDVLAGTSVFLEKTGDLDAAQRASKIIAEIAIATGANMEDVAGGAASLFQQFDTGKTNMEDMREQLGLFVIQGKKGAFEMKDMAGGIERLAAAAKVLGVRGDIKQVAGIGALAQFTRRASGTGERATTSLEGSFQILMRKQGLIKKRYKGDDGKEFNVKAEVEKDIISVLPNLFKAMGGDEEKLLNIFSKRSSTAVLELFSQFKKLEEQTGSQSEAAKILTQRIRDMADAENVAKEMAVDLADQQQTASKRLDAAWERVVQAFGSGPGLDAINALIDSFTNLAPLAPLVAKGFSLAIEALTGFILGIAKLGAALHLPGFEEALEGIEKARNEMGVRNEIYGQEAIARGHESTLLRKYGLGPEDEIPQRFVGTEGPLKGAVTPEGEEILELKRLATQAYQRGKEKELELYGITGEVPRGAVVEDKVTDALKGVSGEVAGEKARLAGLRGKAELESDERVKGQFEKGGLLGAVNAGITGGENRLQSSMAQAAMDIVASMGNAATGISTSGLEGAVANVVTTLNQIKPPAGTVNP